MSSKLIRDAVFMTVIFACGFFALTQREVIYGLIGIHPSDIAQARANRLGKTSEPTPINAKAMVITSGSATSITSGSATSISKSMDGHFWVEAQVNASSIRFLVDTGASVVALTPLDAQLSGINLQTLKYTSTVNTASGQVMAAPVKLSIVSVGNVSVRDVRAVVINKGLPHSLLGMSYLGELQTVEVSKGSMILRQ
ncbi:MAG: TIGR02281 family clan AA aspartic protease [Robiginitomaculum sp.]|nr:MAG: TIGR02281 family clan AA aspartic protease [Robiginitomaculum sp.]